MRGGGIKEQRVDPTRMDWATGICGCCNQGCGLWALACVCPCVVYAQNLTMMRQRGIISYVPFCDNQGAIPGCVYGSALCGSYISAYVVNSALGTLFIVPIIMQCAARGNIREAYGIRAQCGCCTDLCTTCFCTSCALVQQQRHLTDFQHEGEEPYQEGQLHPRHRNTMHLLPPR